MASLPVVRTFPLIRDLVCVVIQAAVPYSSVQCRETSVFGDQSM